MMQEELKATLEKVSQLIADIGTMSDNAAEIEQDLLAAKHQANFAWGDFPPELEVAISVMARQAYASARFIRQQVKGDLTIDAIDIHREANELMNSADRLTLAFQREYDRYPRAAVKKVEAPPVEDTAPMFGVTVTQPMFVDSIPTYTAGPKAHHIINGVTDGFGVMMKWPWAGGTVNIGHFDTHTEAKAAGDAATKLAEALEKAPKPRNKKAPRYTRSLDERMTGIQPQGDSWYVRIHISPVRIGLSVNTLAEAKAARQAMEKVREQWYKTHASGFAIINKETK